MSHKGNTTAAKPAADTGKKKVEKKTPRERFVTVGAARVTKALRAVRNLKNVSSRKSYEYTADDVSKMWSALDAEFAGVKKAFEIALAGGKPTAEKESFKF